MNRERYLWFTDTHLDKVSPWKKWKFLKHVAREKPAGIFLTGDISNGIQTVYDLKLLSDATPDAKKYFVAGNHDYHFSSIAQTHQRFRELCQQRPDLIWMTQAGVVPLNEKVAVIGTEGWYDVENGKPDYLQFTFDWFLVEDFRKLPNMAARIEVWRTLATQSADDITQKLEQAIDQKYKTIYLLTHFPPWKEATRDVGTFMEPFWLPYNTNLRLGRAIEKVMKQHKKRYLTVLAGHCHTDAWIHVARNVECKVNRAKYYGTPRNEEHIFI